MLRTTMLALSVSAAVAVLAPPCWAQTPAVAPGVVEESIESRLQIDLNVTDAAIRKFLPPGWDLDVATQGPAKDCNVRLIFIDRVNVTGADRKPRGTGANQIVFLAVPVKETATGTAGQMIVAGLSADAAEAPGPFGVYLPAITHEMTRSATAGKKGLMDSQDWTFSAASGEHFSIHVKYERVAVPRQVRDIKYFSGKDPKTFISTKGDTGIHIARNATVEVQDRVKEFTLKAGGGRIASLFDGKEKVVSVDIFPWYNVSSTPGN